MELLLQLVNCPSIIHVTHHVEEILPCFKKTLLLKDGEVFDAGATESMLTADKLSAFFGTDILLNWEDSRPRIRKM